MKVKFNKTIDLFGIIIRFRLDVDKEIWVSPVIAYNSREKIIVVAVLCFNFYIEFSQDN